MATYTEQWGSREVVYGAEGTTGRRVILTEWENRNGPGIPDIGDMWPSVVGELQEQIWVHRVTPVPYGASGPTGQAKAATHARVTIEYEHTRPIDSSHVLGWQITTSSAFQAIEVGGDRVFTDLHLGNVVRVPVGQTILMPATEIIIRGTLFLGNINGQGDLPEDAKPAALARPSAHAQLKLGRICTEKFVRGPVPSNEISGQLLFDSEELGTPFPRRAGPFIEMHRPFTRLFLWRLSSHRTPGAGLYTLGGWNHLWNSASQIWDTVSPPLYEEVDFTNDLFPFVNVF